MSEEGGLWRRQGQIQQPSTRTYSKLFHALQISGRVDLEG